MGEAKEVESSLDSMTTAEKHGLIGRFLENILELGGYLIVNKDGTIAYASNPDEPIMLKPAKGDEPRPLMVYRVNSAYPRAILINPFVESLGKDPTDKLWFYNTTNSIHALVLSRILEFIFTNVVKAANGQNVDDPTIINILSGVVNHADPKTAAEFAKLVKELPEYEGELDEGMLSEIDMITENVKPKDFVTISRSKQERRTILTTFLYNQENDLKKKFGNKIRKKTWTLVEKLFKQIYATEEIYDPIFDISSEQRRCPTFITYVKVLIKSWNMFIPYLQYLYGEEGAEKQIDKIIFLESCLDKLESLADVAHWARGCVDGEIQLKGGRPVKMDDDETAPKKRGRPRKDVAEILDVKISVDDGTVAKSSSDDPELDRMKEEIKQNVEEDKRVSAMDIMSQQRDNYYRRDRFNDRDRYYDNRYRDDRYDRYGRYDRDDRREERRDAPQSAMDIMMMNSRYRRGADYDRYDRYDDRRYSRGFVREEPFRLQGRVLL